jgi:hypothetical protein
MPIEKVFAIEAQSVAIWDALWGDMAQGEASRFRIERSNRPSLLVLQVDMAGIPARLTYRILEGEGSCEVSAALEPLSTRYFWLQILTFGRLRAQYELTLVQGLANLKQAVEAPAEEIEEGG